MDGADVDGADVGGAGMGGVDVPPCNRTRLCRIVPSTPSSARKTPMRLSLLLIVCLWAGSATAERIVVFAAASLKLPLDEIAARWTAQTGDEIALAYGGSGAMAQQILQGAPAQVFLSANPEWMNVVEAADLLVPGSRADLLTNHLVVIGPPDAEPMLQLSELPARLGDGRLAVGQVGSVPAGIYARAAFENLGLWDTLSQRLIETDSVTAALRLVALGEAPFGVVYQSDVHGRTDVRLVAGFPQGSHPRILYPAAALRGASPRALAFLAHLRDSRTLLSFAAAGFPRAPG